MRARGRSSGDLVDAALHNLASVLCTKTAITLLGPTIAEPGPPASAPVWGARLNLARGEEDGRRVSAQLALEELLSVAATAQAHVINAHAAHVLEPTPLSEMRLRLATERLQAVKTRIARLNGVDQPPET